MFLRMFMFRNRTLWLFLVVGTYNTVVGYLIFLAFLQWLGAQLYHQSVLALAFIVSLVHAYLTQRLVVFRSSAPRGFEFARFAVVASLMLALNASLLEAFVTMVGMDVRSAQLAATILTTGATFVGHRFWSFRESEQ